MNIIKAFLIANLSITCSGFIFSEENPGIVLKVIDNIPGVPTTFLLDENKSYLIKNGKQGDLTYFSNSTFGIQIEPKKLGNIFNVSLIDGDDGKQSLYLLYKENGVQKKYTIKFDDSNKIVILQNDKK